MSAATADYFPSGLALLGGIPIKSQDLAASIIFTIVYALLLPLAIWRMASPKSRTIVLLRPLMFISIRIGTFIIRCIQSTGNYSVGLFVAEQVLLLSGFVALVEPLLSLTLFHVTRFHHPSSPPTRLQNLFRAVRLLLLVSLALGIYSGTQYSNISQAGVLDRVKACRDVNVIICLVITLFCGILVLLSHFRVSNLKSMHTAHLLLLSFFLTVPSVYRLELYVNSNTPDSLAAGTKVAYYLLSALPEWLASVGYVAFNLCEEYDIPGARLKSKQAKILKENGGVWPEGEKQVESV